jgi:Pyruvate/2-oxoacid:ferredoxin oxidoreductase gamma subunit
MDERELTSQVKALTKLVSADEPAENILVVMRGLNKAAAPSESVLRVSRPRCPARIPMAPADLVTCCLLSFLRGTCVSQQRHKIEALC